MQLPRALPQAPGRTRGRQGAVHPSPHPKSILSYWLLAIIEKHREIKSPCHPITRALVARWAAFGACFFTPWFHLLPERREPVRV